MLSAPHRAAVLSHDGEHDNRLLSLLACLRPGPIVSVARPNTAFQAALSLLGRPPVDVSAHLSAAAFRSRSPWAPLRASLSGTRYLSQVIDGLPGRMLLPSGEIVDTGPIDVLYDGMTGCAAIEIGGQGDVATLLAGAMAVVQRCRPLLALDLDREAGQPLLELLEKAGYVAPGLQPSPTESRRVDYTGLLLAYPREDVGTDSAAPLGRPALRPMLATLRRETASDALGGWQCFVGASELIMSAAMPVDFFRGENVVWTGPGPETTLRLWVPGGGTYTFTLEVAEHDDPVEGGPGTLLHAFDATPSAHRVHAVELTIRVSQEEARSGVLVSHVLPELKHRRVMGRICKVGVPVRGLRMKRAGDIGSF